MMPSPELGVVAMKRREFIALVGGAAAVWPLAANAQQKGKLPLIGVLNPGLTDTPGAVGFYEGLRELGYTEGLNIARTSLRGLESRSIPATRGRSGAAQG
jgi:hypothetical protein